MDLEVLLRLETSRRERLRDAAVGLPGSPVQGTEAEADGGGGTLRAEVL